MSIDTMSNSKNTIAEPTPILDDILWNIGRSQANRCYELTDDLESFIRERYVTKILKELQRYPRDERFFLNAINTGSFY